MLSLEVSHRLQTPTCQLPSQTRDFVRFLAQLHFRVAMQAMTCGTSKGLLRAFFPLLMFIFFSLSFLIFFSPFFFLFSFLFVLSFFVFVTRLWSEAHGDHGRFEPRNLVVTACQ